MKNLFFLFLLGIAFCACKKDNSTVAAQPDINGLDGATVVSTGQMFFADERLNEGFAKIYLRKDGALVFGLEQMNYQTSFSDTNIYLSATPGLTPSSIKIFSAKKLHGNSYYTLTSGINPAANKYVIIQGDADAGAVATAELK